MKSIRLIACFFLALLVAATVTACRTTHYELELHPDGATMQRKLSMWTSDTVNGEKTIEEFSADELHHVSQIYGVPMPTDLAQRHEFEGEFQARLPGDVTDGGWFLHESSAMGSVNSYIEHIGGKRKISWSLETRQVSFNRLVSVWLAWLDSEFGEDERYPPFREFVDVVLRDDLWNVSLYMWSFDTFGLVGTDGSSEAEMQATSDLLVRLGIYLAEHDYLDPLDLPEHVRNIAVAIEDDDSEAFLSIIFRGLARKLGVGPDEPLPWPLLDMASDWGTYEESLDFFVSESDTIREMAESWEQEYRDSLTPAERAECDKPREPVEASPEGEDVVEVVVESDCPNAEGRPSNTISVDGRNSVLWPLTEKGLMLDYELFGGDESRFARVILHLPRKPIVTNGTWEEDGTIRWTDGISPGGNMGDRLPDVFHAFWIDPAAKFQKEHFGKVVLDGEELLEHVIAYTVLPSKVAQEWDDFVAGLEPGPELIPTLEDFCFSADCEESEAVPDSEYIPTDMMYSSIDDIVDALTPEESDSE